MTKRIKPEQVIPTVREHLIGDGFEFVLDLEKSHGSRLYDALGKRELLDFYSCFASNPIGFNHPKMREKGFLADLMQAAVILASFAYNAATRDEMIPRTPNQKENDRRWHK
jgi:4-aminobutyrate aminotransferase-like enzyme